MAEPDRLPFWGSLVHPGHLSLDCGCDCINCDEREWCEEQFFQELEKQRLESEVTDHDN